MTTSKSYFGDSIASALAMARQEIGEDALLISSRATQGPDMAKGRYEVVVAYAGLPSPVVSEAATAEPAVSASSPEIRALLRDVSGLRQQLSRLSRAVQGFPNQAFPGQQAESTRLLDLLTAADVPETLASRWLGNAEARCASSGGSLPQVLRAEIEAAVPVHPELATTGPAKIVVLVGPPGVGKTSTAVKLALTYGVARRRSTVLLTADTSRVGAVEQMRAYAGILGVPFGVIESPQELTGAIGKHAQRDLIIIDTPGFSPREMESARDLAQAIRSIPNAEVHLVLTATARSADLSGAMERWQLMNATHLLVTHMDEASQHGHVLGLAAESNIPISFLSWGRRIPEDLDPATRERLIRLVLDEPQAVSGAAA